MPLGFYKSFVLEHKFDLSNQRLIGWTKDELKKILISFVIFLLFVEFLYLFLRSFPYTWWIWLAGTWILFSIVFAKLVPVLILPLFFKYEELKNKPLKDRLIRLAAACKIKVLDVFRLDLSAKTKKANAALAGIGSTRRVLLGDTLLNNYADKEIEVVLAHELAHHKFRHIWRSLIFNGVSAIVGFYFVHLVISSTVDKLAFENMHDVRTLPLILLLLTLLSVVAMPVENSYSRAMERKADSFALSLTNSPDAFISCMDKLANQNLADKAPSKIVEFMLYNHPPISKRIKMAKNYKKTRRMK